MPCPDVNTVRAVPLKAEPVHRQAAFILRYIWTHPSNRSRRLRRVIFACYFQSRGRFLRRPTVVRLGVRSRIRAYLHESATSWVVYAHPPARDLLVWSKFLRPGDLFLDAGANAGVYTIWAIEHGAQVIAFEPNRLAAERFRENMALNGYKAELIEAAVADQQGFMLMTQDLDVANHLAFEEVQDTAVARVPVVTLDAVLGRRLAAGIKLDVEGAELLALKGAVRALSENRIRLLQLEWNHASQTVTGEDRRSTAEFLLSYGYELLSHDGDGNLSPLREWSFGNDVFARPSSVALS